LLIAAATGDVTVRGLAMAWGVCLTISGGIQYWLLRRRRRGPGNDIAY